MRRRVCAGAPLFSRVAPLQVSALLSFLLGGSGQSHAAAVQNLQAMARALGCASGQSAPDRAGASGPEGGARDGNATQAIYESAMRTSERAVCTSERVDQRSDPSEVTLSIGSVVSRPVGGAGAEINIRLLNCDDEATIPYEYFASSNRDRVCAPHVSLLVQVKDCVCTRPARVWGKGLMGPLRSHPWGFSCRASDSKPTGWRACFAVRVVEVRPGTFHRPRCLADHLRPASDLTDCLTNRHLWLVRRSRECFC